MDYIGHVAASHRPFSNLASDADEDWSLFCAIINNLLVPRHRLHVIFRNNIRVHTVRNLSNKSLAVAEMDDRGHNKHEPKRGGFLCSFRGEGTGSQSDAMWRGPRSTSAPSGVFIHPAVLATLDMGQNLGAGWLCLFFWGSWDPIEHKVALAEIYLPTKWHFDPSSRLTTTDIGRKLGGYVPLGEG